MRKTTLLLVAAAGMELSWLYAWATFLTISILHRPFPFPEAIGAFVAAAVLTRFSLGRGWRIIHILSLQAIGFLPLLLRVLRVFHSWSYSLNQTWLTDASGNQNFSLDWLFIPLVLSWAFSFWGGGVRLIRRSSGYFTLCNRFDRGLGAFFLLFLAKFLFLVKGGPDLKEPVSEFLIFPFLIFSLLAIGLARDQAPAPRDYLPGYRAVGVILSFAMMTLLFGAGLIFLFLPYLTVAAETSYGILRVAAVPLGSLLLKVLRFIFGRGASFSEHVPEKVPVELPALTSSGKSPWWLELLAQLLMYGVWIVLGLILLGFAGIALYFTYRWLVSRTAVDQDKESPGDLLVKWLERIRSFFRALFDWMSRRIKGHKDTIQLYAALLGWGRRSGLSHSPAETPMEYASRLTNGFPLLTGEIESITEAFNREVYGEVPLDRIHLEQTHTAWRRLRHPRHWPRRLKQWFRSSEDKDNSPIIKDALKPTLES